LRYLIDLLKRLFKLKPAPAPAPKPEPEYTRDQFIEAVKELSNDVVWRAEILTDALLKLSEKYANVEAVWIEKDRIVNQYLHRVLCFGLTYLFGDGCYALPKDVWENIVKDLQQNSIKYMSDFTDCDNFATFFRGFCDVVLGKEAVIYVTGGVFDPAIQFGQKVCVVDSNHLIGGHAWNWVLTTENCEYQKVGSTEIVTDDFTIYNYEPQNDILVSDRFVGKYCYQCGGGLPLIMCER